MTSSLGIWIVRAGAEKLGRHLEHSLGGKLCSLETNEDKSNRQAFATCYASYRQWILVMATGIAVRYLQGLPKDKTTDPADRGP